MSYPPWQIPEGWSSRVAESGPDDYLAAPYPEHETPQAHDNQPAYTQYQGNIYPEYLAGDSYDAPTETTDESETPDLSFSIPSILSANWTDTQSSEGSKQHHRPTLTNNFLSLNAEQSETLGDDTAWIGDHFNRLSFGGKDQGRVDTEPPYTFEPAEAPTQQFYNSNRQYQDRKPRRSDGVANLFASAEKTVTAADWKRKQLGPKPVPTSDVVKVINTLTYSERINESRERQSAEAVQKSRVSSSKSPRHASSSSKSGSGTKHSRDGHGARGWKK